MNVHYIGEHLFAGQLGKTLVWVSFATALLSTILYLIAQRKTNSQTGMIRKMARSMFLLHVTTLIGVALVLYYLIFNHYFEYSYVWQYSSKILPVKYIISCFWAGQEGSFMIWAVWQALIGIVLIFISKDWENRVMPVVSLSQVFVTSMLLGIKILSLKVGSSPFMLLRETFANIKDSIFLMPNYLSMIADGNGLNPLLENYWMTIHPPILFLGYALALVPFSYAIASLRQKDYYTWMKPAFPWTILSLTLLGAGILLGGAWAYVSLTFGGFWAWDPVENSSLVPWMTLVAGLHFLIIARKQHYALLSTYIFLTLSYVLVLYASFLTRSGILGDTSAHSFGDSGLTIQLLIYLLVFLVIMILLIAVNGKTFMEKKKEILLSREFWMFIGSVIIVLSAFQVLFTTSIPVFNSIFHSNIAPPIDHVGFYNRWQVPFTLLIVGFIAFTQYLNYSYNNSREFFRKLLIPLGVALLLVIPILLSGIIRELNYILLLYFAMFSFVSTLYNLIFDTSKPRNIGMIITHTGFIIFVMGTLLTFSNSKVISANTSSFDLGTNRANAESLVLMKQDTLYMGGFYVTYSHKYPKGNTTDYQVDFMTLRDGKYVKEFSLYPSVNRNQRMGDVYNPDTRHFLTRDYYTYISFTYNDPDYIVIKTIMNPYINILWAGTVIMIAGFGYSFYRRVWVNRINNT